MSKPPLAKVIMAVVEDGLGAFNSILWLRSQLKPVYLCEMG
jgi:hypothetical protein